MVILEIFWLLVLPHWPYWYDWTCSCPQPTSYEVVEGAPGQCIVLLNAGWWLWDGMSNNYIVMTSCGRWVCQGFGFVGCPPSPVRTPIVSPSGGNSSPIIGMSLTTPWCLPSAGGSFCFSCWTSTAFHQCDLLISQQLEVWPLSIVTKWWGVCVSGWPGPKHQWAMSCTSCSGLREKKNTKKKNKRFGHKGLSPFRQTEHIWKMLTHLRTPLHPRLANHVFFAKFHTGYKDPCTFPDRSVYTFETKLRSLTDTLRWPGCLIIARPSIDLFLAKFLDLCTLQLPPATQLMVWF